MLSRFARQFRYDQLYVGIPIQNFISAAICRKGRGRGITSQLEVQMQNLIAIEDTQLLRHFWLLYMVHHNKVGSWV